MYIYIYIHTYACIHTYMYIYIYIHIVGRLGVDLESAADAASASRNPSEELGDSKNAVRGYCLDRSIRRIAKQLKTIQRNIRGTRYLTRRMEKNVSLKSLKGRP